uniref:Uncharacterized protein n=1 Tax=Glossina pallidipes TaxID=7398 RepID=A0A1A9ZT61_GLOPL
MEDMNRFINASFFIHMYVLSLLPLHFTTTTLLQLRVTRGSVAMAMRPGYICMAFWDGKAVMSFSPKSRLFLTLTCTYMSCECPYVHTNYHLQQPIVIAFMKKYFNKGGPSPTTTFSL